MKNGNTMRPNNMSIEAWNCLGRKSISWLTKLFNEIMMPKKMLDDWRISTLVPIYKIKGDIQNGANHIGIKLMSHTKKVWERQVIDLRLRQKNAHHRETGCF